LVAQYSAYEPVRGYHVNGELTLGENIGDNSGLAIAYKAYQLSLSGRSAPSIDGFTGEQRFYLGWAQVWRGKVREDEAVERVKTDPALAARGTGKCHAGQSAGVLCGIGNKNPATECICLPTSALPSGSAEASKSRRCGDACLGGFHVIFCKLLINL